MVSGREKWLGWGSYSKRNEDSPRLEPCQATAEGETQGGRRKAQTNQALYPAGVPPPRDPLGLLKATEDGPLGLLEAAEDGSTFKYTFGFFKRSIDARRCAA